MASRPKTAQALAQRARIVLDLRRRPGEQGGCPLTRGAFHDGGQMALRFLAQRIEGLRDDPRPGAPRTIEDERIESVIARTLESQPDGATHWSSRGMARDCGLSVSTMQRIWRAFGLKPQETFKLSTDPIFSPKCATLSGCIYLRLSMPWCFASTKSPDPGARPQPDGFSDAARPARAAQSRLPQAWYDVAVRRARCCHGKGHRPVLSASSRHRVPPVPR